MSVKVSRTRALPPAAEDEEAGNDLAARAAALLAARKAQRGNPDAQRLMSMDREPHLRKLGPSRMAATEREGGVTVYKGSEPREYTFEVKIRVYGALPDRWDVNDILSDALDEARLRAREKYRKPDIWTSLLIVRHPDGSAEETEA